MHNGIPEGENKKRTETTFEAIMTQIKKYLHLGIPYSICRKSKTKKKRIIGNHLIYRGQKNKICALNFPQKLFM